MVKNEKNLVLVKQCDWKETLEQEEWQELQEHARSIGGVSTKLRVFNTDAKVYVAGPAGIEKWLNGECAFDKLIEPTLILDKDGEQLGEVIGWYYFPETNEMYADVHTFASSVGLWMSYSELEKFIEDNQ